MVSFLTIFRRLKINIHSILFIIKCKYFIQGVTVGTRAKCAEGVYLACTDQGVISFGQNISIGRNVKIIAQSGHIAIGDNCHIGDGVIITSKKSIKIGADVLIAEYVCIRDQDHDLSSNPINLSGFNMAEINIGDNVWLGAKASVLKGVSLGKNSVVASHAVVNQSFIDDSIVAGVPAKLVKKRCLK